MDPTSIAGIFERSLPDGMMSAALAREVLRIGLPKTDLDHISELCQHGNAGTLTARDESLLDNYRRTVSLITILHLRARSALRAAGEALPPVTPIAFADADSPTKRSS